VKSFTDGVGRVVLALDQFASEYVIDPGLLGRVVLDVVVRPTLRTDTASYQLVYKLLQAHVEVRPFGIGVPAGALVLPLME
jgi:hypothetical protein